MRQIWREGVSAETELKRENNQGRRDSELLCCFIPVLGNSVTLLTGREERPPPCLLPDTLSDKLMTEDWPELKRIDCARRRVCSCIQTD